MPHGEPDSLLDVVQRQEQRLLESANELANARQRLATASAGTAKRSPPKPPSVQQAEHTRNDSAALREAQRLQEQTSERLREAESRIESQKAELAALSETVESARRSQAFAQQRAVELQDELRRQRLDHQDQIEELRKQPPWLTSHPTPAPSAPTVWQPSRPTVQPREPEPPKTPPSRPTQRDSRPAMPRTRTPKSSSQQYRIPKLNSSDHPVLMQAAYRVLHERLPGYIRDRRPDLKGQFRSELSAEDSGLQRVCRRIARRVQSALQRGQSLHDLDGFAADTVAGVYKQLEADPVQQALCGMWPKDERALLKWLAYEITIAMMAEWPPESD